MLNIATEAIQLAIKWNTLLPRHNESFTWYLKQSSTLFINLHCGGKPPQLDIMVDIIGELLKIRKMYNDDEITKDIVHQVFNLGKHS